MGKIKVSGAQLLPCVTFRSYGLKSNDGCKELIILLFVDSYAVSKAMRISENPSYQASTLLILWLLLPKPQGREDF